MAGKLQAYWVMLSVNLFSMALYDVKNETWENSNSVLALGPGIVGFSRNLLVNSDNNYLKIGTLHPQ